VNAVSLLATLVQRDPLRFTPAGVPILGFRVQHQSTQWEARAERRVELEMAAVAMAEPALELEHVDLGRSISLNGFLAPRRRNSRGIVLHVTAFEFIEV